MWLHHCCCKFWGWKVITLSILSYWLFLGFTAWLLKEKARILRQTMASYTYTVWLQWHCLAGFSQQCRLNVLPRGLFSQWCIQIKKRSSGTEPVMNSDPLQLMKTTGTRHSHHVKNNHLYWCGHWLHKLMHYIEHISMSTYVHLRWY